MSKNPLRELIGEAAMDCDGVHIQGDVYLLGDAILRALADAGLSVVKQATGATDDSPPPPATGAVDR